MPASLPRRSQAGIPRPRWTPKQLRVVRTFAGRLIRGRYETQTDAVAACALELARRRLRPRRGRCAVSYAIETALRKLGRPPSRRHWSRQEDRVIDRFARLVVRGVYPDNMAAVRDCREALARLRPRRFRTAGAVGARLTERSLGFGRPNMLIRWTANEYRLIDSLCRDVAAGRLGSARQAACGFLQEMSRRRRSPGAGREAGPPRTRGAVERKLLQRADALGLNWGFRDWTKAEDRIITRFARLAISRRVESIRAAAQACSSALRELNALARAGGEAAPFRPIPRSMQAIRIRIFERVHELGSLRHRFRHWTEAELAVAAKWLPRFVAERRSSRPVAQPSATVRVRTELARRGYRRTLGACKSLLQRLAESRRSRPALSSMKGRSDD